MSDYYSILFESKMFELSVLESIYEFETIDEGETAEKIESILKNVFGSILKAFKKFFDDLHDMFTRADYRHYRFKKSNFSYNGLPNKLNRSIVEYNKKFASLNFDESDQKEALKLLNTITLHPMPNVKNFKIFVKALGSKSMYDLNNKDFKENTLKALFPDVKIKLYGNRIDVKLVNLCLFYRGGTGLLDTKYANEMLDILDEMSKINKHVSVEVYNAYRDCTTGVKKFKDVIDAPGQYLRKLITIKQYVYDNLEFVVELCKVLKPIMKDLNEYMEHTMRLNELWDKSLNNKKK